MNNNIWFNVCAVAVIVALLVAYYVKYNAPFAKYKVYSFMLWCAFISSIASICNNGFIGVLPVSVIRMSNYVYFVAHSLIPPAVLLYANSLIDFSLRNVKKMYIWMLPALIAEIFILSNVFHGKLFSLGEQGQYHRGDFMIVLYIMVGFYFVTSIATLIFHRKGIRNVEKMSLYFFTLVSMGSMCIQMKWSYLLVENFSTAFCLMISQLTVQNPENIMDGNTGAINKNGFSYLVKPYFESGKRFDIAFVVVDNYFEIEAKYGFDPIENYMKKLCECLNRQPHLVYCRVDSKTLCAISDDTYTLSSYGDIFSTLGGRMGLLWNKTEKKIPMSLKTVSGVVSCPDDASSMEELFDIIGRAARDAKDSNENEILLTGESIEKAKRRKAISTVLESGDKSNFRLVYQPIFNCQTGNFESAEALLRFRNDELGEVYPNEFISLAEENGTIKELTKFIIDDICKFMKESKASDNGLKCVDINISAIDCAEDDLADKVLSATEKYEVSLESINLEITETALGTLSEEAFSNFKKLSDKGLTLSLDDYGSGYSNLSRLSQVPFNIAKIDKSLVDNIIDDEAARVILDNTFDMMRRLNKTVLVEGVETKEQADYLISRGCDLIQGFYYSRPLEAEDFVEFLRTKNTR